MVSTGDGRTTVGRMSGTKVDWYQDMVFRIIHRETYAKAMRL